MAGLPPRAVKASTPAGSPGPVRMTTLPRLPDSCTTVSHESQRQLSGVSFDLDRAAVADAAGGVRESPVDDGNVDVHVEVARDDATDRDGGGSAGAGAASSSSSSGSCGSGGDVPAV